MQTYNSNSNKNTIQLAVDWVKKQLPFSKPVLVLLNGDYGVGKTQFVKGMALGLGIDANVTSASYTYIREYTFENTNAQGKLVHVDAWRVKSTDELIQTGILNYLTGGNLVVVEWGHKAEGLDFSGKDIQIFEINITELSSTEREITIHER